ncbi:MAG: hypothetical protein OXN83_04600 [Oligoflexia bacterium]|nr:hypothetical protein [Oligoflexia bacterium]
MRFATKRPLEGDQLIFEVDYMSRSFVNAFQNSYKKIHWLFIGFMCFVILALCFIAFAVSV